MRDYPSRAFLGFMLTVSGSIVRAGPLEDASAAGGRGDYATALRLLRPLAAQGSAQAQLQAVQSLGYEWPVVSGPWEWTYQGKRLDDLRREIEEKAD